MVAQSSNSSRPTPLRGAALLWCQAYTSVDAGVPAELGSQDSSYTVDMPSLVAIESFTSPWEAHIARGRLEAEGIPASVIGEHHVGAYWPMSQALGGVRLMVPESMASAAVSLLQSVREGEFQIALEEQAEVAPARCPHCGSAFLEPYRTKSTVLMAIASLLYFSLTFPPRHKGYRCTSCERKSPA